MADAVAQAESTAHRATSRLNVIGGNGGLKDWEVADTNNVAHIAGITATERLPAGEMILTEKLPACGGGRSGRRLRAKLQTQNYLVWVMVASSGFRGVAQRPRNAEPVTITRNR